MATPRSIAATAILMTLAFRAGAGVGTDDGTEDGFWKDRAVVLARIAAPPPNLGPKRIAIEILGVAATDTYLPCKLADLSYHLKNSALAGFRPEEGQVYVLCLRNGPKGWFLDHSHLRFFESDSAAERVEGPDDPKFLRFLERLARVRAESQAKTKPRPPEPHGAP